MVTKCCVSGCNETDGNGTELTFFKFPKTRHMKQKWLSAIRPRGRLTESSVVCSAHFLKDTDYQRVAGKNVLRTSVVPSVFNVDLKHTSSKRHTRRKKSVSPKPNSCEESDENDDDSNADDEENSVPEDNDKSIQDGEESIGKDCDKSNTKDSENGPIESDNADTKSNGQKCDEEITKDIENNSIKDSTECNEKDSDDKMENNEVKESDDVTCKNNSKSGEIERHVDGKMVEDNNSVDPLTNGSRTPEVPASSLNGEVTSKCDTDKTEKEDKIKEDDNKDSNTEPDTVLKTVDRTDEINKSKETKDNTTEPEKADTSVDTEESTKMDEEDPEDPAEKIDNRTETESNPDYDELIRETQCKIMEMSEDAVPILDNVETILEEDESSKHSVEDVDENLFDEGSKGAEPVFVEISVDPDAMASPSPPESPSDCMMVVEDMQVQVDPRDMIASMDDPADDDDDDDVEVIENRPVEPVSLLTSSDEDDVILEEPHIDTVEVSDETSEDDMPLTRYVKKTSKQQKELNDKLKNIFWGTGSEFYCYSCQYTTKSKKDLSEHMKTHGQVNKKTSQIMVCDICDFQSASEVQFARHKRKHKEDKKHKCHMCDYKARHKMSLVYHMKSHKTVEKIVYKCHKCSYQSAGPLALQRHMTAMHARVVIQCQMCSFTCKKKVNLQRHVRSAHVKRKKATRKFNKKASSSSEDEYVPGKDV